MNRALTRMFAVLFVVTLILAWPIRPALAADPYGIDFTVADVASVQAELRAEGLGLVADRLLVRHTVPIPAPGGRHWGMGFTTSSNWAGFVADMGAGGTNSLDEARGFFTARPVSTSPAVGSFVGIGGFNGTNLWQAGLDQLAMQGWVEAYPGRAAYFTFPISSGDTMFARVVDNRNGTWDLLIQDWTNGNYVIGQAGCCPDKSTGDWIVEAQAGTPIPFFTTINFTASFYRINYDGVVRDIDSPVAQTTWNVKLVSVA